MIKMVLALRARRLPRTLHVDEPSPHVDWAAGAVRLLTEARAWPRGDRRPRRAGVSSFGISGTNAHVILEEAEAAPEIEPAMGGERPTAEPDVVPWVLSGRTAEALRRRPGGCAAFLDEPDAARRPISGCSLATTRAVLDHRAVVLGTDRDDSARRADRPGRRPTRPWCPGWRPRGVRRGCSPGRAASGSAWAASCTTRSRCSRRPWTRCAASGRRAASGRASTSRYARCCSRRRARRRRLCWTRPATPSRRCSRWRWRCSELLRSWGMGPDVVLGHSVGEFAAAHVAGVLSLADAARLVAARGRLMQALPAGGAMVAVQADRGRGGELLEGCRGERVAVAAVNGPASVVVSGDEEAVERVMAVARERGRRVRGCAVSHAFHSPLMEPMLAEFARGRGESSPTGSRCSRRSAPSPVSRSPTATGRPPTTGCARCASRSASMTPLRTAAGEQARDPAARNRPGPGADRAGAGPKRTLRLRCCARGAKRPRPCWLPWPSCSYAASTVDWAAVFAGTGAAASGSADVRVPAAAFLAAARPVGDRSRRLGSGCGGASVAGCGGCGGGFGCGVADVAVVGAVASVAG